MWSCPASAPSQAWPMALAHTCTGGFISTALELGLSPQGCPHHGSLAHRGLGAVLLPRGSLGCDRKCKGWACTLRLKGFSSCRLSLGLGGNCCSSLLPRAPAGHCTDADQGHLWAFHRAPRARVERVGCECVAMWEATHSMD